MRKTTNLPEPPTTAPANEAPEPRMTAPANGVKVRMYRQGLGDCFLLAFSATDKTARYMLIDCGVLSGTKNASETMKKVMASINQATGSHLHVLIVTHEHYDHVSGFLHASETFKKLQIDESWLAWTEDPTHPYAIELGHKKERTLRAVEAAVALLDKASDDENARNTALVLSAMIGFYGENETLGADGASRISQTKKALKIVRDSVSKGPRYCQPGQELAVKGVENARIYVLGPPENELIKRSDPTKSGKEVYEKSEASAVAGVNVQAFFQAAQSGLMEEGELNMEEREKRNLNFPFDSSHRLNAPDVEKNERDQFDFFQRHYFGTPIEAATIEAATIEAKATNSLSWRRIDHDWLGAAGQLALKLDSDTNNTSLVLAIELKGSDKVLLFPADAQVGNWLSWESLSWKVPGKNGKKKRVSVPDLLGRTVLYKVGHHASHNATLRAKGLELMTSPDLVALIPIDEKMARKQGAYGGWDMPFPPLLKRLHQKTKGRIIRADQNLSEAKPDALSEEDWKSFRANYQENELWMEFSVE